MRLTISELYEYTLDKHMQEIKYDIKLPIWAILIYLKWNFIMTWDFFQYKNAMTLDLGDYKKGRLKHELYKNDGFD